jgi:flagellin-like protein
MSKLLITKKRAVSPVIATVILIAVAVALGIAVAFWASGLTSSFSKYEKLGVSTQYASSVAISSNNCNSSATTCWQINLGGQNTGSSDASITQIQINGVPYNSGSTGFAASTTPSGSCKNALPCSVPSGSSFSVSFYLDNLGSQLQGGTSVGNTFTHGQTIQVTIITAAGNNYPASIVLP